MSDIYDVIVSFEKIKAAILIAAADEFIDDMEIQYLVRKARSMPKYVDRLSVDKKKDLMKSYINMAAANRRITKDQFELISLKYKDLKLAEFENEFYECVVDECMRQKTQPPPQLENYIKSHENTQLAEMLLTKPSSGLSR